MRSTVKRLSNVVRINLNAGWQLDRTVNRNYLTYGAGFDWRTPDNVWTLTGEVFGLAGVAERTGAVEPRFGGALALTAKEAYRAPDCRSKSASTACGSIAP